MPPQQVKMRFRELNKLARKIPKKTDHEKCNKKAPTVGLEPTTTRLKVLRSAN